MYPIVQRCFIAIVAVLCLSAGSIALAEESIKDSPVKADSILSTPDQGEDKISINSATAEELSRHLKGIGSKKAEAIIEYREKYGDFTSIEQLREVPGVGPALYSRNQSRLKL